MFIRKGELSTSFEVHMSTVLQQLCFFFTAISLFSLLIKLHLWRTSPPPFKCTEIFPILYEDKRRDEIGNP